MSEMGKVSPSAYRFGFVLTVAAGNMTRYLNLRKYAERVKDVECVWAPVKHYLEPDPFLKLPGPLRTRAIVMREADPVLRHGGAFDAIMFHAFEPYVRTIMTHRLGKKPVVVWSADNPPHVPRGMGQVDYGGTFTRSDARRRLRYKFDLWCASRVDLFVPFSKWAGDILVRDCKVPAERVHPLHVGLDLELWPHVPRESSGARKLDLLFVGGDFKRKGGDLLLSVWRERFRNRANLHLVTRSAPEGLQEPGVFVYPDMSANDERLRRLYAESDIFVLPTNADVSSWVALEGAATGRPVVSTRTGGIPDLIHDGETGYLVDAGDAVALAARLQQLIDDDGLRDRMGKAGRALVETDFSAAVCVPRILDAMKRAVDGPGDLRPPSSGAVIGSDRT